MSNIVNPDVIDEVHNDQLEADNQNITHLLREILNELKLIRVHQEKASNCKFSLEDVT